MEDILLLDAAERYFKGEMNETEKVYFEDLRKNNADLDQVVAEHIYFLQEIDKFSDYKQLKHRIQESANTLEQEGIISRMPFTGKSKVIYLWNRYKKTIAVAASIAVIVSVFTATIIAVFNPGKHANIKPLVEKLKEQDVKYKKLATQIDKLNNANTPTAPEKPRLESKFRATGFMIDVNNNYLVTNAHVLTEAKNHLIVENNKGDQFVAETVYINNDNDLAILKINDPNFKKLAPLPYSIKNYNADLGESVFILGYPKQEIVYNEGYVSAQNGYQMDTIFCQLSTIANEGNSGSPVLNKNGELVGVISSMETNSEGVVFAIKSSNIFHAINEMKKVKENDNIKITSKPILRKTDRVTQIKKLQDYVFMIKGD